jgi:hypothetical protein
MGLFLLVVLLLLPALSQATTYYVAPSGGGGCSTNRNAPQGNLTAALQCLSAGDTLYLRAGTYTQSEMINPVPSGPSDTTHTTIAGDPQDGALAATIRGTGSGCCLFTFVGSGVNRITLDNLRLDGAGVTGVAIRIGCSNCGPPQFEHTDLSHHITLQNLEILNIKNSGILSGSFNTIYRNNHIHHTGSDGFDHGIYLSDNDTLLQGNIIHDTTGYGIHYFSNDVNVSGAPLHHGVMITGNTTYNNTYSGIIVNASDDALVYNNVSYHNGDKGLYAWGGNNARIYNNTLYQNSGSCLRNEYGGVTIIQNNLCSQNGNDAIDDDSHNATVGQNLSTPNAFFANAGAADFHLTSSSTAAIDQGANLSAVFSIDFEGTPRPLGSGFDIGAYERGGLPPPTRLRFTLQPQSTPVGQTMAAVVVQAQDASGNLASSFTQNILVDLVSTLGVVPFAQTSLEFADPASSGTPATAALDGDPATFWHTPFTPHDASTTPYPHTLIVNLGAPYPINGFRYLPRQDGNVNGTIALYQFAVSLDGSTWGVPVVEGTFSADTTQKTVLFSEKTGQYVWLQALSEINGQPWASVAELTTLYNAGAGSCPGALTGTKVVQASGGQSTFTTLSVSAAGTCQLQATAPGMVMDTSNTFVITGSATHLGFVAQPSTVVVGQTLPPVTVQFLDGGNNPFPTTQAVNIALATCPGASLGGTGSRAANSSGLATFNDLSVNGICPGATLIASASGMTSATSAAFAILTTIPDPFLTGEWTAHGVASHACAATNGDTNVSGSTPGVDHVHTLTCPFPANVLTAGALLESCALVDATTQGTGTRPAFGLRLGGVTLSTSASTGTSPTLTTNAWLCFLTAVTSAPGASVPTYTSFALEGPGFAFSGSKPGVTPQPVNAATSSPQTAGFISHWETAGDGLNTITLHSMILGLAH